MCGFPLVSKTLKIGILRICSFPHHTHTHLPPPPPPHTHTHSHTGERISLWDIKDFPLRLWLVFIIGNFYYATMYPFIGLAT